MTQYNFICENGHANLFTDKNNPPVACSDCSVAFEEERVVEVEANDTREVTGLTLIYQIDNQRLEISTLHKAILGRENFGASIFSKILFNGKPVVSRKHCSIEFKEGQFYLLDETSLNGTFYGVNKLSCKDTPQIIEDKSIIYLGQEAFLAQINYRETKPQSQEKEREATQEVVRIIKRFRCNEPNCGFETETEVRYCPKCKAKNLIPIYE